ncbi:hypothetical protein L211DRAFT_594968 [Terfezia boudieri ATCC MYA-4762]|uniref:Uncharacterized protein n=1 Tax=Terfezia boudieri ATCC MYA-4762 TaxID=1051890 RepID=A0A3N4LE12_9PEZI|nr:hypothetical protein L211DRAFT_594968 [Terfezia boudieri ATCC MYA-4762]
MSDSAAHQPPPTLPTHSVAELLQKMKRAKTWWWQRDDILKARMSTVIMALVLLAIVLTLYLALLLTHRLTVREFHIVLILLLLFVSLFFLFSLFRLFIATISPEHSSRSASLSNVDNDIESQIRNNPNRATVHVTFVRGPGGYAIPAAPIPIAAPHVEINGNEDWGIDGNKASSAVTALPPPAYGLWRSSVRVNPDQFYWVRRAGDGTQHPPAGSVEMEARTPPPPLPLPLTEPVEGRMSMAPVQAVYGPPSYISEDGVDYVLGGPRFLPGTVVLAAPAPAPVRGLGIGEIEGEECEVDGGRGTRERQQGSSAPSSRDQSPSGIED